MFRSYRKLYRSCIGPYRAVSVSSVRLESSSIQDIIGTKKVLSDNDVKYCLIAQSNTTGYVSMLDVCSARGIALSKKQMSMVANAFGQDKTGLNIYEINQTLASLKTLNIDKKNANILFDLVMDKGNSYRGRVSLNPLIGMFTTMSKLQLELPQQMAVLRLLTKYVSRCNEPFSPQVITRAFSSLKKMDGTQQVVRNMLKALTEKLVRHKDDSVPADSIAGIIYAVQNFDSRQTEVQELHTALASKLRKSSGKFGERAIARALYGLKNMSSDQPATLKLVVALAESIAASPIEDLPVNTVYSVCYGLRGQSSSKPEVRQLLRVLAERIRRSSCELNPRAFATCLYGMRTLRMSDEETRALLQAVMEKTHVDNWGSHGNKWSPVEVSLAMKGVENMDSSFAEARIAKQMVCQGINHCKDKIDHRNASASLYSFNSMTSSNQCALQLLGTLTACIQRSMLETEVWSPSSIAMALYGLRGMVDTEKEVMDIMRVLIHCLRNCNETFTSHEVAQALYGMRTMSSDNPLTREMIGLLTERVNALKDDFNTLGVSHSLHGLGRMSSEHSEIQALLKALHGPVMRCPDLLDDISAGMALFGLQRMTTDCPEVVHMLNIIEAKLDKNAVWKGSSLASAFFGINGMYCGAARSIFVFLGNQLEQSKESLTFHALTHVLKGLHSSDDYHAEVRRIHSIAAERIEETNDGVTAQSVASCLYSLKNMNCYQSSTIAVVRAIANKMEAKADTLSFTVEFLWTSLFGLKGLTSRPPPVQTVMTQLAIHLERCTDPFGDHFGSAMVGMLGKSCDHSATLQLVSALATVIAREQGPLSSTCIGGMLYGLQDLDINKPEVVRLFDTIVDRIMLHREKHNDQTVYSLATAFYGIISCVSSTSPRSKELVKFLLQATMTRLSSKETLKLSELYDLNRSLSLFHHFCKSQLSVAEKALVPSLISQVETDIRRRAVDSNASLSVSLSEQQYASLISKFISDEYPEATVSLNEMLHGFECDIVIRVPASRGRGRIIDIELDGPLHMKMSKINFRRRRDMYLQERHGIEIARIDVSKSFKSSRSAVDAQINRTLNYLFNCRNNI